MARWRRSGTNWEGRPWTVTPALMAADWLTTVVTVGDTWRDMVRRVAQQARLARTLRRGSRRPARQRDCTDGMKRWYRDESKAIVCAALGEDE